MEHRQRPKRNCHKNYGKNYDGELTIDEDEALNDIKTGLESETNETAVEENIDRPTKRRKKKEVRLDVFDKAMNEISVSGINGNLIPEKETQESVSHIEEVDDDAEEEIVEKEIVVDPIDNKLETYTTMPQYCDAIQTGATEIEHGLALQQFVSREMVRTEMFESYMKQHSMNANEAATLVQLTNSFNDLALKPVVQDEYKPLTLSMSIVDLLLANKINLSLRMDLLRGAHKTKDLRNQFEIKKLYRGFAIMQNRVPDPEYGELECVNGQRCCGMKYAYKPFMRFVSPTVFVALTQCYNELKEKNVETGSSSPSINDSTRKKLFDSCYKIDPPATDPGLCRLCLLRLTTYLYNSNVAAYLQEYGDETLKGNNPSELLSRYECEILQVHYYDTNKEGEYKSSACIPDNKMFAGLLRPILKYNEDIWFSAMIPMPPRNKTYAGAGESDTVVCHGSNQQDF
jgi:hypothetical protein